MSEIDVILYQPVSEKNEDKREYESNAVPFPPPCVCNDHNPLERHDISLFEPDAAFVLKNVLSPSECQFYIDESERMGIPHLDYSTGYKIEYRNNARLLLRSAELAELLWKRTAHIFCPLTITDDNKTQYGGINTTGAWHPIGFNDTFRLCKYNPGGHFAPHYDGHYLRTSKVRSMKTFMIYLNGGFEGGKTNWVDENQMLFQDQETGIFRAEDRYITGSVVPESGIALVFNHHLLHEGERLRSGVKYILRTEVMYEKQIEKQLDPKEEEALQLLEMAEEAEYNKESMRAAELYRRAFKLWPQLEDDCR